MKTIVVATDFSVGAHWATNYALKLATHLNARLLIAHAYDPNPVDGPVDEGKTATAAIQYELAIRQLSRLRTRMMSETKGGVNIAIVALPGERMACIEAESLAQNVDLLVMGLAGNEPLKARQLGSLATDMIPRTRVPMLLVPPGATYHKPKNMVLAVDLSQPVDALAIDTARQFAHLMKASLDIVCIEDEPDESERKASRHIRDLLRDQPHTFRFIPGYDVALALEEHLAQHKADLIMLLPKSHSRFRTMLLESVTQEVARLATVPVLAAV